MRDTTEPRDSYGVLRPDDVHVPSAGLGWDFTCNYDVLSAFRQRLRVFDVPHLIINLGPSPARVRHRVRGPDGWHEFNGAIRPGELVFVPAGCPVAWELCDSARVVSIRLPPTWLESAAGRYDIGPVRLRPRVAARVPSTVRIGRALLDTLRAAQVEVNRARCRMRAAGLALELAVELIDHFQATPPRTAPRPPKSGLARVREYLANEFVESPVTDLPDLAEAAKQCDLSPYYFSQLVRQVTGSLYDDHVKGLQMGQAGVWLLEGKSIKDTAHDLGYDDKNLKHFYGDFKRHHRGQTPHRFRSAGG